MSHQSSLIHFGTVEEVEMPDEQPFIADGSYEDEEWRKLAADPEFRSQWRPNTREMKRKRYESGPRRHPFGPEAFLDEHLGDDGQIVRRWFRSREARDQYVNEHEADQEQRRSREKPAASEGNPAQRQLEESS